MCGAEQVDFADPWFVYVLRSANGRRTYVGVSNAVARRLEQHNGTLPGGARSTRGGRPWTLVRTLGPLDGRARAQQVEYLLKRVSGTRRLVWAVPPELLGFAGADPKQLRRPPFPGLLAGVAGAGRDARADERPRTRRV